jgi:hydroxyacylglutathione hydrolase
MIGTQAMGAKQMYQSINKFNALADYIQVWPGHGAGSACGKALGSVPSTTVGYEKARNWAFQYPTDETGFVKYLLADQPEPPKYFAKMKHLNKVDRPLLTAVPKLKKLSIEEVNANMAKGIKLLDARNKTEFAAGFIPGSLNIQGNNSFATWAGWFLTYDEPFMLLADESMLDDLTRKLMRIGLDNIAGYLPSVDEYTKSGGVLEKATVIDLAEAKSLISNPSVQTIDLRGVAEYNSGHIKGADNVFVGTLPNQLDKISKSKKVMIHCQGGDRASIAYSILAKNGFNNIVNYSAGMNEWVNAGEPVVN